MYSSLHLLCAILHAHCLVSATTATYIISLELHITTPQAVHSTGTPTPLQLQRYHDEQQSQNDHVPKSATNDKYTV
jgi:hypothetical protein